MRNEPRTIGEAWLWANQECMTSGREYKIDRGSFVGQRRKQLNWLAFTIARPWERPLGIEFDGQAISDDESINRYFEDYLINPTKSNSEQYTYASRIGPQLANVSDMLRETPNTNQAVIEIARPNDTLLPDPPCLRVLSWKVIDGGLQLASFWRSWDLYAALPTNLGGLQLLNELMAEWANVKPGPLVCASDGAHIYDHSWGTAPRLEKTHGRKDCKNKFGPLSKGK